MLKNIGIDIGGTTIKSGIVDEKGHIIFRSQIPTQVEIGFDKISKNILTMIGDLILKAKLAPKQISGIGVGIPGVANKEGMVYYAPNLFWENVELGRVLQENYPSANIVIDNDGTVAAVAEQKIGSIKGVQNAVMLTLGTGIGSGLIINGSKFSGHNLIGSEIGHVVIGEDNFYRCNCGCLGCFETYCSATAVIKYAQKLISEGEKSSLTTKMDLKDIDAKAIFDGYVQGDWVCIKTVDRFLEYFSTAIANIVKLLDPEYIVLGGGMSNAYDLYIKQLEELVAQKVLYKGLPISKIIKAQLGNDAGIIGAAMLSQRERLNG